MEYITDTIYFGWDMIYVTAGYNIIGLTSNTIRSTWGSADRKWKRAGAGEGATEREKNKFNHKKMKQWNSNKQPKQKLS